MQGDDLHEPGEQGTVEWAVGEPGTEEMVEQHGMPLAVAAHELGAATYAFKATRAAAVEARARPRGDVSAGGGASASGCPLLLA